MAIRHIPTSIFYVPCHVFSRHIGKTFWWHAGHIVCLHALLPHNVAPMLPPVHILYILLMCPLNSWMITFWTHVQCQLQCIWADTLGGNTILDHHVIFHVITGYIAYSPRVSRSLRNPIFSLTVPNTMLSAVEGLPPRQCDTYDGPMGILDHLFLEFWVQA